MGSSPPICPTRSSRPLILSKPDSASTPDPASSNTPSNCPRPSWIPQGLGLGMDEGWEEGKSWGEKVGLYEQSALWGPDSFPRTSQSLAQGLRSGKEGIREQPERAEGGRQKLNVQRGRWPWEADVRPRGARTGSWLPHLQLPRPHGRVGSDLHPHGPHSPRCHSLLPEHITSVPLIIAVPVILITWGLSILDSWRSEGVTRKQM